MKLALLLSIPLAARAQLALYSYDGSTETPVSGTFNFGTVAAGDARDARFRIENTGSAAVNDVFIQQPQGDGFSRLSINGIQGATIAPKDHLEFTIRFTKSSSGSPVYGMYSANLLITSAANNLSALLLATLIPAPALTVFPSCQSSAGGIQFPDAVIGSSSTCDFLVQNPSAQPLDVTITIASAKGFDGSLIPAPGTLKPNDSATFSIRFAPVCGTLDYSTTLTVNGRAFPLRATGRTPPLPRPSIAFDSNAILSGEQHSVTLTLPSPAACAATGNLNLTFTPAAGAAPDSSIVFVSGAARSLPFSVAAGDTHVSVGSKSSAVFQTGTTAGTIAFSLSGTQIDGDPTTIVAIAPAPVTIDSASASNQRAGELDISITAFDNTYSTGAMSFTFFDPGGNPLGSPISADFSSAFHAYFAAAQSGSAFLMRVSFPIEGDPKLVAKVQVTMNNAAGQTQTQQLLFQ